MPWLLLSYCHNPIDIPSILSILKPRPAKEISVMRKFRTSMLFLLVIAVVGSLYTWANSAFYDARYTGYMVSADGNRLDNSDVLVTLNRAPNGSVTMLIKYASHDEMNPAAKSLMGDSNSVHCRYNSVDPLGRDNGRVEYHFKEVANTRTCGETVLVFPEFDSGQIQINTGAVFQVTRIPNRDVVKEYFQSEDFYSKKS